MENLRMDNWFIEWLSEDLEAFKMLCKFWKDTEKLIGTNQTALENLRERIIDFGRLMGHHSYTTYRNCF